MAWQRVANSPWPRGHVLVRIPVSPPKRAGTRSGQNEIAQEERDECSLREWVQPPVLGAAHGSPNLPLHANPFAPVAQSAEASASKAAVLGVQVPSGAPTGM